jgi:xanthine dehydrogenase iron-sulfur cluster and FAD-binding subunit A
MWQAYYSVHRVEDAFELLAEHGERARLIAGGTDLILEMERGVRKGIDMLVDISRIPGLDHISLDAHDCIHIGPLVTHNDCAASRLIIERAFPLAQAAWEVGAPQIRNRGTVAGNLITASPANDTITPLIALEAQVSLRSKAGERTVPLSAFYNGVRQTVMQPDEMLVDISFPAMKEEQRGAFLKVGLRRAQAIAVVNGVVIFSQEQGDAWHARCLSDVRIALGAVAPTIIRAQEAEIYLDDKILEEATIDRAAVLASQAARPISDLRGSAEYRTEMVRVIIKRLLESLHGCWERETFPREPVLLKHPQPSSQQFRLEGTVLHKIGEPIRTRINGKDYIFTTGHDKTLLRLLREEANLTGSKEGCSEGECGACTVILDGMAVMSCLVPAARAHNAEIVTIEGLAEEDRLHPVQQAFIETGAVQCGYCTPGLVMSAAMLLDERPQPARDDILTALSGNLCRCTGYYSIIEAVENAAKR